VIQQECTEVRYDGTVVSPTAREEEIRAQLLRERETLDAPEASSREARARAPGGPRSCR